MFAPDGTLFIGATLGVLGAIFGSGVTALAWRLPRHESWVQGRSRCPSCGHVLGPLDLVPVLSWMLARGRCRYCRAGVSARYPLIELACAAWAVLAWVHLGLVAELAPVLLWGWLLVALTVIDLDFKLLPDALTLPGTLLAVTAALLGPVGAFLAITLAALVGALAGGVLVLRGRGGMQSELPFGTCLAPAAMAVFLWGDRVVEAYFALARG